MTEPTPPPLDSEAPRALSDWIVEQGLTTAQLAPLIEGLCQGLEKLGLPLWRMHVSMSTLHPTYRAFGGTWRRNEGFSRENSTNVRRSPRRGGSKAPSGR